MKVSVNILLGCVLAVAGMQANALLIDADSCVANNTTYSGSLLCWRGDDPKNPKPDDFFDITGNTTILDEYYKYDAQDGEEEKEFVNHYSTILNSDLSGGTISWDGGSYINCPECYLLVKDGNHDPRWYLFDLGSWSGMEAIVLTGFWDDNGGAISHLSIWGEEGQIPEPAPLALIAVGLLGLGLRRFKKAS